MKKYLMLAIIFLFHVDLVFATSYLQNLVYHERFNGSLSGWTTSGTPSISTVDNSPKLVVTSGDTAESPSFTEPSTSYIIEFDVQFPTGPGTIELLDSGDTALVTILLGDTADKIDFSTDTVGATQDDFTHGTYKQLVLLIDPVGNTASLFMTANGFSDGYAPHSQIGSSKAYSGGTVDSIKFSDDLYVDEIRVFTPQYFITGDSIADGKRYWSDEPGSSFRTDSTEDETSPPNYQASNLFDSSGDVWIADRGFGGSEIEDISTHLDPLIVDQAASRVIVWVGHNNIANGDSFTTIKGYYETLFDDLATAGISGSSVMVCNIIPGTDINTDLERSIRFAVNAYLYYEALDRGYKFCDMNSILTDPSDIHAINPSYDDEIAGDLIHLNPAGSALAAQEIYENAVINISPTSNVLYPFTTGENTVYELGTTTGPIIINPSFKGPLLMSKR